MKCHRKCHRYMTLIEVMIVIFILGIIASVVTYNMRGTLEEAKAFKTRETIEKVKDILLLEIAKGYDSKSVIENPEQFLKNSGLVKDARKLLEDGWGEELAISYENGSLEIVSTALDRFEAGKIQQTDHNASSTKTKKSSKRGIAH